MKGTKQRAIGCFLVSVVLAIVILLCSIISIVPEGHYLVPVNRERPHHVSALFINALVDHQASTLKSLSKSELLPRIENWLETHEEVNCNGPLWWQVLDVPPIAQELIVNEPGYKQESLVHYRQCMNVPMNYCVKVSNIDLRLTDDGWLIENWENIEEELVPAYALCPFEPQPLH